MHPNPQTTIYECELFKSSFLILKEIVYIQNCLNFINC